MAGLLKPQAAYELISAMKDAVTVPIHLHSHEGSGNTIYTYARAIDAGVDIVDVAMSAMSNGTAQPSASSLYYALEGHPRQPKLSTGRPSVPITKRRTRPKTSPIRKFMCMRCPAGSTPT